MGLKRQSLRTIIAWGVLVGFMMLFQPDKLPVVGLIVPFVLLFWSFYNLWILFGMAHARYFPTDKTRKPRNHLGMALCASGVLLLVLQSLGQLTVRDVVTVVASVVLGYLYLTRSSFMVQNRAGDNYGTRQ